MESLISIQRASVPDIRRVNQARNRTSVHLGLDAQVSFLFANGLVYSLDASSGRR